MKTLMNFAVRIALLLVVGTLIFDTALAQDKKAARKAKRLEEVKQVIENRRYVFEPTYMNPMRGGGKQLTSDYDMQIRQDSLISYLPYSGQAYQAPVDPTKNALDFTSTKFEYTTTKNKKGGWEITIVPKDNREIQKMFLTISEDGYATLRITSYNRDAISFEGTIEAPPKPKG
ncbi:hypothetical protein BEL04_19030 [Mucilaginibacter sp. PPCGB 2223]|uniref:DUF4251 domain-containing protein n=1 Tax=Mucilaginibacter sp. PPCGB 2223 TaxID=1886027 RepID=UPI0008260C88|nr:DUF4251 domain-containing protein [Mucilaginibacter sp. PPCGB 2223]OCX50825.1 hypothetical protein BEL04_19030 [Mucilaginibacter sp. PPCGB 2223]